MKYTCSMKAVQQNGRFTLFSSKFHFNIYSVLYDSYIWAQNLRQGIVMKTSFETRVSGIGPGSFVNIHIFVMKYFSYLVSPYSPFLSNLLNQIYKMLKPQKGNAGVSFNDTLLNFGLCIQGYLRILWIWSTIPSKID